MITTIHLAATLVTAGKSTSSTDRDVHAALGAITAGMYITTAYDSNLRAEEHLSAASGPATANEWILEHSTLFYYVSHPSHQIDGVSHAARGKGVCDAGE